MSSSVTLLMSRSLSMPEHVTRSSQESLLRPENLLGSRQYRLDPRHEFLLKPKPIHRNPKATHIIGGRNVFPRCGDFNAEDNLLGPRRTMENRYGNQFSTVVRIERQGVNSCPINDDINALRHLTRQVSTKIESD